MVYLLLALLLAVIVFAVLRRKGETVHPENENEIFDSPKEPSEKAPPEDTPRNV